MPLITLRGHDRNNASHKHTTHTIPGLVGIGSAFSRYPAEIGSLIPSLKPTRQFWCRSLVAEAARLFPFFLFHCDSRCFLCGYLDSPSRGFLLLLFSLDRFRSSRYMTAVYFRLVFLIPQSIPPRKGRQVSRPWETSRISSCLEMRWLYLVGGLPVDWSGLGGGGGRRDTIQEREEEAKGKMEIFDTLKHNKKMMVVGEPLVWWASRRVGWIKESWWKDILLSRHLPSDRRPEQA